jgi:DNA mismatch repair protein MutS2
LIYPENFEKKTGFDKIRKAVAEKCSTEAAQLMAMTTKFSSDRLLIETMLAQTSEMKSVLESGEAFPEDGYIDVSKFIPKLRIDNAYLEPDELLGLSTMLNTIRRIQNFFRNVEDLKYPYLRTLSVMVDSLPAVSKSIDEVIDIYGAVKDRASVELQNIRREIRYSKSRVRDRIQSSLKWAAKEGIVDSDASITVRDGRTVIPVPAANKRKLKGLVLGVSASGRTVFIEPVEVIELNNEIRELEFAERREIIRILIELTDSIRVYYEEIRQAAELIIEIDFIRAKARYAIETKAIAPKLCEEKRIYLCQAVHPLLAQALNKDGKQAVPLDLELDHDNRILLISGPNAGGKSVCLKTVGLFQYMTQCGFLISAMKNSELGIFKKIFIDMGDEQSIENDLSTYSSHLSSMKFFLSNSDRQTLVLIDEFGSGTEPVSGGAIAESILESLLSAGVFGVITTHYSNLKYFAAFSKGIFNGAMMFDTKLMRPLFKLELGVQGSSFAFQIARKTGIPENIITEAEKKIGENHAGIEQSLRQIAEDKLYIENKMSHIKLADKHLEEITKRYEKELLELHQTRRKLIAEAKDQAKQIIAGANREIENAVRTIREAQADREKTMEVRRKIEEMKLNLNDKDQNDDKIAQKLKNLKEHGKHRSRKTGNTSSSEEIKKEEPLKVGEKVKIEGQTHPGEIISVSNSNVSVAVGSLILNLKPERVKRISANEYRNFTRRTTSPSKSEGAMSVRRLNFKPYIDLRGCRATEAIEQVRELLDEAMVLGVYELSILHGKGNGILKNEIRKYLQASYRGLIAFTDASEEAGGAGITIVSIIINH